MENDCHNKSSHHLSPSIATKFFFMMRTFKIYSLSNFQIYNTVLLTIVSIITDILTWKKSLKAKMSSQSFFLLTLCITLGEVWAALLQG